MAARRKPPIELLRAAGLAVTPPGGGWVVIRGNTLGLTPRGMRIPKSIAELGVEHLDIYWAYNEEAAFTLSYGARDLKHWLETPNTFLDHLGYLEDEAPFPISFKNQLTWMQIATPNSEVIRFYNGEVSTYSDELIRDLLEDDGLEVIRFGVALDSPLMDEVTRDIIDSLQIDGMSKSQAVAEVLTLGLVDDEEIDTEDLVASARPKHFYRMVGIYADHFKEEHAY